ncbi:MAG TPA: penicillin-binding protein 2 [Candidatus Paceibacterota bacterium]
MKKAPSSPRIRLIAIGLIAFALVLVGRLYFLQIIHGQTLAEKADHQYVRSDTNLFDRGSIFLQDKDGRLIAGATIKSGFTISIDPSKVLDAEATYTAVNMLLPIDHDAFMLHAVKKDDPYEEIAKRVPENTAKSIEALKLPGVSIYKEQWRFYPGGELAAQTLGFVGYDDSGIKLSGSYGLERFYENILARDEGSIYINFFAEVFTSLGKTLFSDENKMSGDVVTTIEPSVQLFLDHELKKITDTWSSARSGGIVIDPKTGEIYAMALYPSFDTNNFSVIKDPVVFSNQLVEGVYEMGSIVKPLTMAAGLDAGVVTATSTYDDKGFLELNGSKFSNFDGKGRGVVPMQEVLNQSLNTGAAFVESQLGNKRFAQYMEKYGLGEETGIDLPSEAHGLIDNLKSPRDLEYATASFGQGIAMTPIEMVRAASVLANGGVLITPHLVKTIRYDTGISKTVTYNDGNRVLKPETSEEITRMLVQVVDKALAGGTVKIPRYSVAAKTGTAQIAKEGARGYYDDRYLHSFFGYFPAYNPRFLVFLYTVDPKGVNFASQTLTAPFMETTKFLIDYYDIPPDR